MSNLKDFDYERYLAGDPACFEGGTPFEGEIFYSKIRAKEGYDFPLRAIWYGFEGEYNEEEFTADGYRYKDKDSHRENLKMAPKKTKWYLGYGPHVYDPNKKYSTGLWNDKEKLKKYLKEDCPELISQTKIIEIELEE